MLRPVVKLCCTLLLAGNSAALAQQYTISTVAGGAPPATPASAVNTSIGQPHKVAVAGSNLYFSSGNSVFKLDSGGTLSLVAGNSRAGFAGDGGPAVNAQLNSPQGIALDSAGNIYIADSLNNRVRKVDSNGIITTFAGNGSVSIPGFWGDTGQATDANLHIPVAVAVDSAGNVYICAASDHAIRKVAPDGTISLFAGTGYAGYYGDTGAAGLAGLRSPEDIATGPDNSLIIADTGNAVIRKVGKDGVITTVSGSGGHGIGGDGVAIKIPMIAPFGVAVNSAGDIFVAEVGSNRIRKIDSKGNITTAVGDGTQGFAGDGAAPATARLSLPTSVAVDAGGNLYFADSLNYRVRKLAGSTVSTVAGNGVISRSGDGGAATSAQLNTPLGVAVDSAGNIYIADAFNNVVRRVASNGIISIFAGTGTAGSSGDGGAATSAQLSGPQGVAVDATSNVYIADTGNNRVRKVGGGTISTIAGSGTGGSGGDGGAATAAQLNAPFGVALDTAGNVYIADFSNNRVRKVAVNGTIATLAGSGVSGYGGDGGNATSARLNGPQGVAVDAAGNVYIADTANNRVRKVTTDGVISTLAGNGVAGYDADGGQASATQVGNPTGVAADTFGNVYIADGSSRVRKVFTSGIIATIAGNGQRGYSGDGGAAGSARLNGPSAVAVNAAGNVYVADTSNNAVRLLQVGGFGISLSAIVSAASNLSGPIAPGEVVVLYGAGLGPAELTLYQLDANGRVPTGLAGTTVLFNGAPAPILYTSANQVAAVVPYAIAGSSQAQVFAQYQGQTSAAFTASVATAIPALFTLGSGTGQAAAINTVDGSLNGVTHPAKPGQFISLYLTGAGQTDPAGQDGVPNADPLPKPVLTVTATVAGIATTVQFAGGAPNLVAGVIQVNVRIPTGIASLTAAPLLVPVEVQVGTSRTQPNVTIYLATNYAKNRSLTVAGARRARPVDQPWACHTV
jgi:uncharacterized protein (TIGR03437 family)